MSNGEFHSDGDGPHLDEKDRTVRLQEFYLPVHGYVRLYPEEVAIVNHPAFQRLRRCRQLGFAHILMPGAVHTRFEHCVGAVHVAEKMIQYVNANFYTGKCSSADKVYEKRAVLRVVKLFIRLGALLHDIGHLPLGHTLEDELDHLHKHDDEARINDVAEVPYPEYSLDCKTCKVDVTAPVLGWSLHDLVNALYQRYASELRTESDGAIEPFVLLKHITLKPPSSGEARTEWDRQKTRLAAVFPVDFCRDVIGNTICADFLDYLHRDWFHIGKPIQEDRRLYAYMEARVPKKEKASPNAMQFVINVEAGAAIRHDALTNIYELLEFRYKLFETVLFHRSKLALTALLDRCLLELRALYREVSLIGDPDKPLIPDKYLQKLLVSALLAASDDDLPAIIEKLANGWSQADRDKLDKAAAVFKTWSDLATERTLPDLEQLALTTKAKETFASKPFDIVQRQELIKSLARGIANRTIYTLATRVPRRSFFPPEPKPNVRNPDDILIPETARSLRNPEDRLQYLLMIETLLGLPRGAALVYVPAQAAMSAKIADVKLLIDNRIVPFLKYELDRGDDSLTGGALHAQVLRFIQLWGASVYIRKDEWQKIPEDVELRDLLRRTLNLDEDESQHHQRETQNVRAAAARVRTVMADAMTALRASRPYQQDNDDDEFAGKTFPSELPYPFTTLTPTR